MFVRAFLLLMKFASCATTLHVSLSSSSDSELPNALSGPLYVNRASEPRNDVGAAEELSLELPMEASKLMLCSGNLWARFLSALLCRSMAHFSTSCLHC